MKTLTFMTATLLLLTVISCSRPEQKTQPNLTGKVYCSSDSVNQDCKYVARGTDYYQTLLFVNDSQFIKVVNTCCGGGDTSSFAYAYYDCGTYKLDDTSLTLSYKPNSVVAYYKGVMSEKPDSVAKYIEYSKVEKFENGISKMKRFMCKDISFFKDRGGNFDNQYVSLTSDTLDNYKKELNEKGIWQKLFEAN